MYARNSLPRHILVAAQEGLAARHARVEAQIEILRNAMQVAGRARPLWTQKERAEQAEKMRRWWRLKKRRQAQQAQRSRQPRG